MIYVNHNGNTTTRKPQQQQPPPPRGTIGATIQTTSTTSGRKRGRTTATNRGPARLAAVFRFFVFFVGATVVSMPFLVSFLSTLTDYESSTLEAFLIMSKGAPTTMSLPQPPFSKPQHSANHKGATTHYLYSLDHPPPDSPYTILHTVTTRFMVGQAPDPTSRNRQHEIQKARYLLFETFCQPTVQHQTSMNFYWIVLVDPGLDPAIIQGMTDLLGNPDRFPAQNAFLVLTNNTEWSSDGIGVENSTSYGVGLQPVAQEFRAGNLEILTGNTDYLLRSLEIMAGKDATTATATANANAMGYLRTATTPKPSKPLLVVETLLDADDGLNNRAVEWIQTKAVQRSQEHWTAQQQALVAAHQSMTAAATPVLPSLNATWWFLCGTDHIEWHNREIFQLTQEAYQKVGISSGLAGLRQSPLFCTSAGFTRVGIATPPTATAAASTTSAQSTVNATAHTNSNSSSYSHMVFPKDGYSNHALTFYFPECTPPTNASHGVVTNGNYSACWHREFPHDPFILKSRTITSDSMDHLNPAKTRDYRDIAWMNASDYPLLINDTEHIWKVLETNFSIDRTMAWETSVYIFEKRNSIIKQNKESRCSPGFPCFKTAKRNLVKIQRYWAKQRVELRLAKKRKKEAEKKNATTADAEVETSNTKKEDAANAKPESEHQRKARSLSALIAQRKASKSNPNATDMDDKSNSPDPEEARRRIALAELAEAKKKLFEGLDQTNKAEMESKRSQIRKAFQMMEAYHVSHGTSKTDGNTTKVRNTTKVHGMTNI